MMLLYRNPCYIQEKKILVYIYSISTGSQNNFLFRYNEQYHCKWDGIDPTHSEANEDDVDFINL